MGALIAVDAVLDQATCLFREAVAEHDNDDHVESALKQILEDHPELTVLALSYHLGRLTLLRADCYIEENALGDGL